MKKAIKSFILGVYIVLAVIGAFVVFVIAIDEQEIAECNKWASEAKEIKRYDPKTETGYFISPWQKEQCDSHGIQVDAYVLVSEKE
jgi:hypothetical protein